MGEGARIGVICYSSFEICEEEVNRYGAGYCAGASCLQFEKID